MIRVDESMWAIWEQGDFTGDNRPVTRAMISKEVLRTYEGTPWRTLLFASTAEDVEIQGIRQVTIDRRLGADAAQMKMTIANQTTIDPNANLDQAWDQVSVSPTKRDLRDLGKPGIYTFRRGLAVDDSGRNPWAHDVDPLWVDMFIPNRVIKTFQGYGTDGAASPADDTKLVLTGVWLIDKVSYQADGTIEIECRDLAKLLIEQRLYPPIIPLDSYPLEFCADRVETETVTTTTTVETAGQEGANIARRITSGYDSSVAPWYGINGAVYGHRASDAFDGDESTYWMSVGNSGPNEVWSYEWIGADCQGNPVNRIKFKPKWGGYTLYVAVRENGAWQGSDIVPYGANSEPAYPNGSNVPYVLQTTVPNNENWMTIDLDRVYNADEVRLIFTNLAYSGLGTYPYRAAVYEFQVMSYVPPSIETVDTTSEVEVLVEGNIDDYTDIIKILLGWSGFFWPKPDNPDQLLERWYPGSSGRIWGDFFYSGAWPVDPPCIPPSFWDNKSVMDGINQIKEILGFIGYVDHSGGFIWRPPNIWRTGNYISGTGYVGSDSIRVVDENKVLIDYGVEISDENLRSNIIVVSADDPTVYASITPGFAASETIPTASDASDLALLGGQERIMLVPNYPFGTADDPNSQAEVSKFAFLVSLWIHWSYRKSKFRIPGMPALMPDDQIRIYERITSETYIHYIQGVRSTMDMDSGAWFMDIDTHWLGNGPDAEWVVNIEEMPAALYAYLRAIGQISDEVATSDLPDEFFSMPEPEIPSDPIRVDSDYDELFPLPVGVQWPDATFDTESDYPEYITPPTSTGGGSAYGCSNAAQFARWGPGPTTRRPSGSCCWKCNESNLVLYTFLRPGDHANQTDTIRLKIDSRSIPAWKQFIQILIEEAFPLKLGQCSSYNCRPVKKLSGYSTTTWSNHSWGIAVDINSLDYPQGKRPASNDPIWRLAQRVVDEIRTLSGKPVFRWGGTFSTPDPMHFEICASSVDVKSGVTIQ